VTRVVLQDGTVVLLKRVATAPVVSVQLYAMGGLTAEDAATNGLGGLAMECVPRGSKTRSAEDIATFFDSIGGQFDTTCGNNSWVWQAQFLRDDLGKAMEVFADVVKNPSFPDDEVKAMKERIAAAIESQDNNWMTGGNRYFRKVFFGPSGSPYQFTALGTKENVAKFDAAAARKWYDEKVLKGKRVLAIYGDIDVAGARKLVAKCFGEEAAGQEAGAKAEAPVAPTAKGGKVPSVTVDEVNIQPWDNPEAGVFIGFKSDSLVVDGQREPLIMADTLTSGYTYPTGYIFETLRGMGVVYDANAQNFWGIDRKLPGTFWAYAGCEPKDVDTCIDEILLNIARLQGTDQDIEMNWFGRAKSMVASVDAMENETAASQASTAALDELFGLGYAHHEGFAERIKAVTVEQVREAARGRLRHCVIAVCTKEPGKVKAKAGTREYREFPAVDLTPQGVQHDTGGANK
jgi:zinc protease